MRGEVDNNERKDTSIMIIMEVRFDIKALRMFQTLKRGIHH